MKDTEDMARARIPRKEKKEQVKEKIEERRKAKRTPGKEKDTIPTRESNAIIAGDGTT